MRIQFATGKRLNQDLQDLGIIRIETVLDRVPSILTNPKIP